MDKKIDTGFIYEPLVPEDWLFGSSKLGLEVKVPDGDWTPFLPTGELQKRQDTDKKACVSFGACNVIETEFNFHIMEKHITVDDMVWLKEKGYIGENGKMDFSDRFIAILSGTRTSGNSIKKVADAIRKNGLIPETMFPYRKSMSWLNYYGYTQTPNTRLITSEMRAMGQEFIERFPINYEFVNGTMREFNEARKYNPLKVFLFAYNGVRNGVYTRVTLGFNHLAENHNADQIFDSYDPYIKTMASNFLFGPYATRYIINFKKGNASVEVKKKMDIQKLHQIYQELLLREPDDFAKPYLKFEEEYVRKELGKSKERQNIIKWVNRLRKIKLI